MASRLLSWSMVFFTIFFTVYGQLVMKWQVDQVIRELGDGSSKSAVLLKLLLKPWVVSAFMSAFAASLCWMLALSRLPLSRAYPFMSLSFLIVSICSVWFFNDTLSVSKSAGMVFVVAGLILISQG